MLINEQMSNRHPEFRRLWKRVFPYELDRDDVMELELGAQLHMHAWTDPDEYVIAFRFLDQPRGHTATNFRVTREGVEYSDPDAERLTGVNFELITNVPGETGERWIPEINVLVGVIDYLESKRAAAQG